MDLAFIESVERLEQLGSPLFHWHTTLFPLPARRVGSHHPRIEIGGQPRIERFAKQTRQRRRATVRGKRNRDTRTSNNAAGVRAGMRRIVHRVDEHAPGLGRGYDLPVDISRRGRDDVPHVVEIGFSERATDDRNARLTEFRSNLWRHDGDVRAVRQQSGKLSRSHTTAANNEDSATVKL